MPTNPAFRRSFVVLISALAWGCRAPAEPATAGPETHRAPASHHHKGGMPHRFEDAEAWSKHFDDPARDKWQKPDEVIAGLALPPDAVVADLGAGTGYFSVRFARAVPEGRVIAIDVEPDMVRHITERSEEQGLDNVTVIRSKQDDPSLPDGVDVVFVCNTYHHIDDRSAYFARLRSQVGEGTQLVIVDFKPDAPEGTPGPPRQHRVSIDALTKELRGGGFEPADVDRSTLPYQYVATFVARD